MAEAALLAALGEPASEQAVAAAASAAAACSPSEAAACLFGDGGAALGARLAEEAPACQAAWLALLTSHARALPPDTDVSRTVVGLSGRGGVRAKAAASRSLAAPLLAHLVATSRPADAQATAVLLAACALDGGEAAACVFVFASSAAALVPSLPPSASPSPQRLWLCLAAACAPHLPDTRFDDATLRSAAPTHRLRIALSSLVHTPPDERDDAATRLRDGCPLSPSQVLRALPLVASLSPAPLAPADVAAAADAVAAWMGGGGEEAGAAARVAASWLGESLFASLALWFAPPSHPPPPASASPGGQALLAVAAEAAAARHGLASLRAASAAAASACVASLVDACRPPCASPSPALRAAAAVAALLPAGALFSPPRTDESRGGGGSLPPFLPPADAAARPPTPGEAAVLCALLYCGRSGGESDGCTDESAAPEWVVDSETRAAAQALLSRLLASWPFPGGDGACLASSLVASAHSLRAALLPSDDFSAPSLVANHPSPATQAAATLAACLSRLRHPVASAILPGVLPLLILGCEHTSAHVRAASQAAAAAAAAHATRTSLRRDLAPALWAPLLSGLAGCEESGWRVALSSAVAFAIATAGPDDRGSTFLHDVASAIKREPRLVTGGSEAWSRPVADVLPSLADAMGNHILRHTKVLIPLLNTWMAGLGSGSDATDCSAPSSVASRALRIASARAASDVVAHCWLRAHAHAVLLWPGVAAAWADSFDWPDKDRSAVRTHLSRLAGQFAWGGDDDFEALWRAAMAGDAAVAAEDGATAEREAARAAAARRRAAMAPLFELLEAETAERRANEEEEEAAEAAAAAQAEPAPATPAPPAPPAPPPTAAPAPGTHAPATAAAAAAPTVEAAAEDAVEMTVPDDDDTTPDDDAHMEDVAVAAAAPAAPAPAAAFAFAAGGAAGSPFSFAAGASLRAPARASPRTSPRAPAPAPAPPPAPAPAPAVPAAAGGEWEEVEGEKSPSEPSDWGDDAEHTEGWAAASAAVAAALREPPGAHSFVPVAGDGATMFRTAGGGGEWDDVGPSRREEKDDGGGADEAAAWARAMMGLHGHAGGGGDYDEEEDIDEDWPARPGGAKLLPEDDDRSFAELEARREERRKGVPLSLLRVPNILRDSVAGGRGQDARRVAGETGDYVNVFLRIPVTSSSYTDDICETYMCHGPVFHLQFFVLFSRLCFVAEHNFEACFLNFVGGIGT